METERAPTKIRHPAGKPTPKQVYALAHELCERCGLDFPETRGAASALIERLRRENGEGNMHGEGNVYGEGKVHGEGWAV